jgi:hypothetical protein
VVCDRLTIRIHTQFNGHPSEVHIVLLAELDQPEKQALLRRLWLEPESFRPQKTSRDITEAAAKRLNDLREAWLNPAKWTDRVPEVTPLGMSASPYPDRILPKPGHEKDLAERTLTKLYNQRPAWLDAAHKALDMAVAQAYGWTDYTAAMPDEEILKRLLALNLERAGR